MTLRDLVEPARMERVAVVGPVARLRAVLVTVADAGLVEPELPSAPTGPAGRALERARRREPGATPPAATTAEPPDLAALESAGDLAALAGEAELEHVGSAAVDDGTVAALAGWCPASAVGRLHELVAPHGGAIVRLRPPRGTQPPTQLRVAGPMGAFQPLVNTYVTVPYADLNPSLIAGLAYVAMFGMMFGDVGQGALVLLAGIGLRLAGAGRFARVARFHWAAPFVIGAGLSSMAFGFAYGECFGPTGLVPTLWMRPLDHATTLLAVAIAIGATLLALAYVLGAVNRWREGGAVRSLVALPGLAGGLLYLGLGVVGFGWYRHSLALALAGAVLVAGGLGFGYVGLFLEAGGRASGALQAGVEMFDGIMGLGTNTVSFARLAAFGLTHAALAGIVWSGTVAFWDRGGALGYLAAGALFLVGNAVTFALEGLVAGVQALRLEYYELFSRVFTDEGRAFRPWHVPIRLPKEAPCLPG